MTDNLEDIVRDLSKDTKALENKITQLDEVDVIIEMLELSIKQHENRICVPSVYQSCVLSEALDNITKAYTIISDKYNQK